MKAATGTEILQKVIDNWWTIREKFYVLEYPDTLNPGMKGELLKAKGEVARRLQPLIYKVGNPQDIHNSMIRFMRRIASLQAIRELPVSDLRTLEKECHHIYILLNKWYGEITLT
jgi:hypothetical protein